MTKHIGDGDARDFDETRRLLYMALAAPRTKKYNLAGTLVNALRHHHAVPLDADVIMEHVIAVIDSDSTAGTTESVSFLEAQIARITAELGDGQRAAARGSDG